MADIFGMETYGASPDAGHSGSVSLPSTGDLRRRYNFGDRISELSIAQDPFFRFVSSVAKKPTKPNAVSDIKKIYGKVIFIKGVLVS